MDPCLKPRGLIIAAIKNPTSCQMLDRIAG